MKTSNIIKSQDIVLGERIISLDLLRGFAAFGVAIPHFFIFFNDSSHPFVKSFSILSVEIFFVLSGFVLAPQILFSIEKNIIKRLPIFFARRWIRTLPPYLLALITISIITENLWGNDFIKYFTFTQNTYRITVAQDYFNISWSLSIEEWYYVAFPVFLVAAKLGKIKPVNAGMIFLVVFVAAKIIYFIAYPEYSSEARRLVILRLDAIVVGFLLYIILDKFKNIGAITATLFTSIALIATLFLSNLLQQGSSLHYFLLYIVSSSICSCAMIILAVKLEGKISKSKVIRVISATLGKWSYSIYLFHMLLLIVIEEELNTFSLVEKFGIFLAAMIIFSATFFWCFEKNILRLRPKIRA